MNEPQELQQAQGPQQPEQPEQRAGQKPVAATRPRTAAVMDGVLGFGSRVASGIAQLADRVVSIAPRIPVRDLATLRRQFPGLTAEELADKLVTGAVNATSTVGAGIGAAAMLPVPYAMPTELAAEVAGVAAIELKLIAELHEVYGRRPPGGLRERSIACLTAWSGERGIDVATPWTLDAALGLQLKRELRQRITKRLMRNLPNLAPFMVGAAVGALINRHDTRKLATRIRDDLRRNQVPWEDLPQLPPLEPPADVLPLGRLPGESGP
jgi:hypothetical protein